MKTLLASFCFSLLLVALPAATPVQATTAVLRCPVIGGCARTPAQLQVDLRGALALGDVNRVAESYHWVGMSSRAGERTLDRLQRLIGRPVVDSQYFDAQIASSTASTTGDDNAVGGDAGLLQLMLGDGHGNGVVDSAIDFSVRRYAGCYFVTF